MRAHEAELRDAGVAALSVFGSAARDDAGAASDVDVLVRLHDAVRQSGFHYFGVLAALEQRLHDILDDIERIEQFTAGMNLGAFVAEGGCHLRRPIRPPYYQ